MEERKELEKIKPEKATLKLHGKEREIKFRFSEWAILEKEYGGLKNLDKIQEELENRPFETLPHLLFIGLMDKEGITEENILDEYGISDLQMIADVFRKAFYSSLPVEDKRKKIKVEAKK